MKHGSRLKICMLITNEVLSDGRVMRSAKALAKKYDVEVIGWLRPERKDSFKYNMLESLPFKLHLIELGWSSKLPKNMFGYFCRYLELFVRFIVVGRRVRPWAIHAHELDSLLIGFFLNRFTRAKLIYDSHELYREFSMYSGRIRWRLTSWMEKFLMRRCADIIACNRHRAEIMQTDYGAPFLPKVIRNLPPYTEPVAGSTKLKDFARNSNPDIKRIIGYTGGLAGRGIDVVFHALAQIPEDVALVMIGYVAGNTSDEMASLKTKYNLENRVFVHPHVPYEDLAKYVCSADLGLVIYPKTNLNNYYCAPNKLHEFAMAGLPIVVVDFPPCREFLEEYHYGRYFAWDSADDLARAIMECFTDDEGYKQMQVEALRAAREVNWDREQSCLLDIYDNLRPARANNDI